MDVKVADDLPVSDTLDLRAKHSVLRNGEELRITTLKTTVTDAEESKTVKRTIDGEKADLQLKWVKHSDGTFEFVHLHCMKDWESSNWSKTFGFPIEELYDVTQASGTWIVRCKKCGRRWSSAGDTL